MVENSPDTDSPERLSAQWLELRESLDTEARHHQRTTIESMVAPGVDTVVDLGCGSGAASLWLQPLLPPDQRWVLIDHDPDLLALTTQRLREAGAKGEIITVNDDVSVLAKVLADHGENRVFLLASALLDLMRPADIDSLIAATARYRPTGLISMTVDGHISWEPALDLDSEVQYAFNRHQRRGSRLGPDAAGYFTDAAQKAGVQVRTASAPWKLHAQYPAAQQRFLTERVEAAADQLRREGRHSQANELLSQWLPQRLEGIQAGTVVTTVGHQEILLT